ncbi:MAG: peroxiredoxin [Gammaproteobacteria bacterium]|nr:peroxiredoxin [Gammaproteobacteria bacterium]
MISVGDRIPSVDITLVGPKEEETLKADHLFAGKRVVLFGLPGAFTPTCSASHLPGFVVLADEFKARGVDMVACLSVNDHFVMRAWGKQQNAEAITLLADIRAELSQALGLAVDIPGLGGVRSRRYAMIVDDGVVTKLNVEEPQKFDVSDAETMLTALSS